MPGHRITVGEESRQDSVVPTAVFTASTGLAVPGYLTLVDATAGAANWTISMSAAAAGPGAVVGVKKSDASSNPVNILPPAGNTINQSGTQRQLLFQAESAELVSDGVSRWVVRAGDIAASVLNNAYAQRLALLKRAPLPGHAGIPAVMSSPPAIAMGAANAATAIASSVTYNLDNAGQFRIRGANTRRVVTGFTVWDSQGYANTSSPPWAVETQLETVDATGRFEVILRGSGGGCRVAVWQNGRWEYITRGQTFNVPADGNGYRGLVTLGAAGTYMLRIEFATNAQFGGIAAGPTDTLRAGFDRPLRCIVVGDSFTEPTVFDAQPYPVTGATATASTDLINATAHGLTNGLQVVFPTLTGGTGLSSATTYYVIGATANTFQVATSYAGAAVDITADYSAVAYSQTAAAADGWVQHLAHLTGWDCWSSGSGGTGWINPGSGRVKFAGRLAADVFAYSPDIIIWAGGINDYSYGGYTYAALYAEALADMQAARTANSNVIQFVVPGFWRGDITSIPSGLIQANDALKAATAQVPGAVWVPLLPLPLASPTANAGVTGTIQADAAPGATSISSSVTLAVGCYIRIGAVGAVNQEFRKVTGVSGSGPYTLQFSGTGGGGALANTHTAAAADPITAVGPYIYSGTGRQGSTTGSGNSDRYTGSDGTHPTVAGHKNIAWTVFREILVLLGLG